MSISDKLTTIAENEQKVFDAGKTKEWSDFWDVFQQQGNRRNYSFAFSASYGEGWTTEILKPKYKMQPTEGERMFCALRSAKGLKEIIADKTDFSQITNTTQLFSSIIGTYQLPTLNFQRVSALTSTFIASHNLTSIDKIIIKPNCTWSNTFQNCSMLSSITIEGTISRSIDFSYSPLSIDSMKCIISCLENFSGTASEHKYTLAFKSDCWAALNADSTPPTGNTWEEHITLLGWIAA